jgi:outer membrane protein assembly factor BamE (lipoprotein component of BamABCDE complex)
MNGVSLGMTKEEVFNVIGRPDRTAAKKGDGEYLIYYLYETIDSDIFWRGFYTRKNDCFVRLVDGVVESYGKAGDFDSMNK